MFYCNDNKNENTGLTEAISVFRGNNDSNEESFTIGAWDLTESLNLAVILPTDELSGVNRELDTVKSEINKLNLEEINEDFKIVTEFLSREFTLDIIKDKTNYKITSAFSNYIKDTFPQIDGIIYNSVKYENKGQNIVLWPEVVDKKLVFWRARKLCLKNIGNKTFVQSFDAENIEYDKLSDTIKW